NRSRSSFFGNFFRSTGAFRTTRSRSRGARKAAARKECRTQQAISAGRSVRDNRGGQQSRGSSRGFETQNVCRQTPQRVCGAVGRCGRAAYQLKRNSGILGRVVQRTQSGIEI